MKCANCGKEIRESDAFCPYCGEPLTGFGTQQRDGRKDGMTYIGSFDDFETHSIPEDDRTYLDTGNPRGHESRTEDRTYLDSTYSNGRYSQTEEERTYFDSSAFQEHTGNVTGEFNSGGSFAGRNGVPSGTSPSYSNPYGNPPVSNPAQGAVYGSGYLQQAGNPGNYGQGYPAQAAAPYRQQTVPAEPKNSVLKIILAVVAALLVLVLLGAAFFMLRDRTPNLDDLTYDELVAEYDLVRDDGDEIKTAYNDSSRIEFEDVLKSSSGFKATAVVYTPDMEKIYAKTTDESGIIDRLERVSDDGLHKTKKIVIVDKGDRDITQSSAEELRELIDNQFVTIDEYNTDKQAEAAAADTGSASSDSGGSTSSNSSTNNTYNYYSSETPSSSSGSNDSGSSSSAKTNSGYVIADSSSRYISSSELSGLSKWQCCVARNEIYARHGRMFERNDLQSYFNNCTWYTPRVSASSFNENVLNAYERENVKTIKAYEQAHGYL